MTMLLLHRAAVKHAEWRYVKVCRVAIPRKRICTDQTQRRQTEPLPVASVSRPPVWDGCRECSALACRRRYKHWTNSTRDRRVKPRNRSTAPIAVFASVRVHRCPKTEKTCTRTSPYKNASDQLSEVRSGLHTLDKAHTHTHTVATRRSLCGFTHSQLDC